MRFSAEDESLLDGEHGQAAAYAMKILIQYGRAQQAEEFVPIHSAHIDACLYHGQSSLDFVEKLVELGGKVRVPATMNVAALDTFHDGIHAGHQDMLEPQERLTALYAELGCLPTLTCAPYQRITRPLKGEHIAWAESNAIVFANSVLGAKTDRYGDFADICAALTGRVPLAGLHIEANRQPTCAIVAPSLSESSLAPETYFACLGFVIGRSVGGQVPFIYGLPNDAGEDALKALGAAAASSGSLAMFHVDGLTPEADQYETLARPLPAKTITQQHIDLALRSLCPLNEGEPIGAICLGTPHYSLAEFTRLTAAVAGLVKRTDVEFYVSTSREIARHVETEPAFAALRTFGVTLVVDTCTYLAPVVREIGKSVLTTSGKWAYYAPGNLGYRVGLASLDVCVNAAVSGNYQPA